MGKIIAYNFISLNGYYKGADGDTSWHRHGKEEEKYSEEMLALGNVLLFGRKTYELMTAFWPTPAGMETSPKVAAGMNAAEKIVFSNTLNDASWENSRVLNGNIVEKMEALKKSDSRDFAILGSGSIINLFTDNNLIDEYQVMVDPVAIGKGTPLLEGIKGELQLKLTAVRAFDSGVVLLTYVNQ
ncbi:dihydrofolate reductase family protein [Fulvivirga kasyanovii]|uniref:Dihydrofolate reductase n=1 Tax=Fulvivirga kasyanovii TaxID=396812 RepID=A0ABW9RIS2_9BACT|nr:dihydrofolate reductase family protein [Fulvivirga kasyanovii]MTI23802.1 dihydrofolate reductase [Fulvivirga kasyanovii]